MTIPTVCTTDPLKWVAISGAIFSTNISWWLMDIPLLFTHGFSAYINSVTWQCLRVHLSGVAAAYAISNAKTHQEQAYIYYIGPFYDAFKQPTELKPSRGLSAFQFTKVLVLDLISLAASAISLNEAVHTPADFWDADYKGIYNVFVWIYPTVPVALIGLWLLLCSVMKPSAKWTKWGGVFVLIKGALAILIPTQFISAAGKKSLFPLTIIAYILMVLPIHAIDCGGLATVVCGLLALIVRQIGFVAGALVLEFYFPFCALKSQAFAFASLAVGIIGAVMGIWGRFRFRHAFEYQNQHQNQPPSYILENRQEVTNWPQNHVYGYYNEWSGPPHVNQWHQTK